MISARTCPLHYLYKRALFRELTIPGALANGGRSRQTAPERALARWLTEANVGVYLSSHTCLPVMRALSAAGSAPCLSTQCRITIIRNGWNAFSPTGRPVDPLIGVP